MQEICTGNITVDPLSLPSYKEKDVMVSVLRLDKIHPVISGNKWFKLRFYLEEAKKLNKRKLVTFGGAWSNHIVATAAACRQSGFSATGIIRGEEPVVLSSTLRQAKESGMELIFISREDYRSKKIPALFYQDEYYLIPEGGYGANGAAGAATILDYCIKESYSHLCGAAGTGTMLAGLINGSHTTNHVIGISVLKNNRDLERNIQALLTNPGKKIHLIPDYHFGGYARFTPGLISFMNDFFIQTSVPSDFVYTGKLFFAIHDLILNHFFPAGSRLLLIHSGGLQGNASLDSGTLIF